jgi:hypothetical protein
MTLGIMGWFSGRHDAADTFSYLITALIGENAPFEDMSANDFESEFAV